MSNLYVIEGTSNSGKTTTLEVLGCEKNIAIFQEFMKNPKAPRPSKTLKEELENQIKFYELEKERMILAKQEMMKNNIVFLDRSYISILAVSYAFEKMGKYNSHENALKQYYKMIAESWYIIPEIVFILTASYEEKLKRNKERTGKLKENWIKETFEYYQKEFYDIIELSSNKMVIDTTDKEKEYAANVIKKILSKGEKI